jgi:hypothetical protein
MVAGRKDRWSDIIGGDGCTVPLRYSFFMIETLDRCCKEREGGREGEGDSRGLSNRGKDWKLKTLKVR